MVSGAASCRLRGDASTSIPLAWWLTTPSLLLALDWDNAFHLWQIDRLLTHGPVQCGFGGSLWTCGYTAHLALQPLYGVGAAVARVVGGETLDGLRAMNAVAIAIARRVWLSYFANVACVL